MGRVYNNIIETVGRTPLVRLNRVTAGAPATTANLAKIPDKGGASLGTSTDLCSLHLHRYYRAEVITRRSRAVVRSHHAHRLGG